MNNYTKEELLLITEENERKWKEKFSYENLFKNAKKEEPIEEIEQAPSIVENKSKFRLFMEKIKSFFKKYSYFLVV